MKAYKLRYNDKERKVEYIEFNVANALDFSKDPDTNFVDGVHAHSISLESAKEGAYIYNSALDSGVAKMIQCKECDRYFFLSGHEIKWYQNKNFDIPKRCTHCRRARHK